MGNPLCDTPVALYPHIASGDKRKQATSALREKNQGFSWPASRVVNKKCQEAKLNKTTLSMLVENPNRLHHFL